MEIMDNPPDHRRFFVVGIGSDIADFREAGR
jgi:hypothetical protein